MTSRGSTVRRDKSQLHDKTIMLEIKIRKHLQGIVKYQPQHKSGFSLPPSSQTGNSIKKHGRQVRLSNQRLVDSVRELDTICSSLKPKQYSRPISIDTSNQWLKLTKSVRNTIGPQRKPKTRPSSPREVFAKGIQYENINRLNRFITGGYIEDDDEDSHVDFNSIELTHKRFCSLEKMYDVVRKSEEFQNGLSKSIEPPGNSLAGYVYKCEKHAMFRGESYSRYHHKTRSQNPTPLETSRQLDVKSSLKKTSRKKYFNRQSMEQTHRDHDSYELLESLRLMKKNITERV